MLSHTDGMLGGETYIKRGDGKIEKIEGPTFGCAYIIQGGMLGKSTTSVSRRMFKTTDVRAEHLASRAIGVSERIASVTSFRADIPGVYDVSYTTNTRHWTNLEIMYKQWAKYRLAVLAKELQQMRKVVDDSAYIATDEFKVFAKNQIEYLKNTWQQMVPYELHKLCIDRYGIPSYTAAPETWKDIQSHPLFHQRIATIDERVDWDVAGEYIGDLAHSQASLAKGLTLQGQNGPIKWTAAHPYIMGDELLRQGQRELFLRWAEGTGLLALIS